MRPRSLVNWCRNPSGSVDIIYLLNFEKPPKTWCGKLQCKVLKISRGATYHSPNAIGLHCKKSSE